MDYKHKEAIAVMNVGELSRYRGGSDGQASQAKAGPLFLL